jgi:YesN/AraC family two-component response regulator
VDCAESGNCLQQSLGMPVTENVNTRKVQTAAKMLDTTSIQIQEVASYVGINDPNCFSKIFKKHTGSAPSKYRKGGRR